MGAFDFCRQNKKPATQHAVRAKITGIDELTQKTERLLELLREAKGLELEINAEMAGIGLEFDCD